MNCKPNDLAMIVRIPASWYQIGSPQTMRVVEGLIGKVVRVLYIDNIDDDGEPCWLVEEPVVLIPYIAAVASVQDCILQPLNPEGELEDINTNEELTV